MDYTRAPAAPDDIDDNEDVDAALRTENPGDISDSLVAFPRQVFEAVARASVDDITSHMETEDGDVIEDVDFRHVDIDRAASHGRFVVRSHGHHNKALAAGVVVTGAALIAASLGVRYRAQRRHGAP
ncbi:MAG: hypothetical protein JWL83_4240 [Actinomycetia bacterium]|nr:hypothetical protein [Actinomycetes bacterium]